MAGPVCDTTHTCDRKVHQGRQDVEWSAGPGLLKDGLNQITPYDTRCNCSKSPSPYRLRVLRRDNENILTNKSVQCCLDELPNSSSSRERNRFGRSVGFH